MIIGINKMDSCKWDETRFNEIKSEMLAMVTSAGFKPKKIPVIPFSGFHGENLIKPTDKMPWFKGWEANITPKEKVCRPKPGEERSDEPFEHPVGATTWCEV